VARQAERRRSRYFGGLAPEDHAWRQRFDSFNPTRQPAALASVQAWVTILTHLWLTAQQRAAFDAQRADGTPDPGLAATLAPRYAAALFSQTTRLLLFGGAGSGKTHLLVGAYHALIDVGVEVRYVSARLFLDRVRATWDGPPTHHAAANRRVSSHASRSNSNDCRDGSGLSWRAGDADDTVASEEALLQLLINTPVLLLDGLDADVSGSRWAAGRWARIFEERAQRGRPWAIACRSQHDLTVALGGAENADRVFEQTCSIHLLAQPSWRRHQECAPAALIEQAQRLERRQEAPQLIGGMAGSEQSEQEAVAGVRATGTPAISIAEAPKHNAQGIGAIDASVGWPGHTPQDSQGSQNSPESYAGSQYPLVASFPDEHLREAQMSRRCSS
jgi:hypothetical protein